MERKQTGWGIVGGAATAFLLVRAMRRTSPRKKIIHQVDNYLDHMENAEVVVERRGGGIRRVLVPVGMFLLSRWVISRVRSMARGEQFNQAARKENRAGVRERARGYAEMFEIPSPEPYSENLRPEEKRAFQSSTKADDLKVVEGIGPAISEISIEHGIRTFHDLAEADVDRISIILNEAGIRNLADPETWPQQARLAEQGYWDELNDLKGKLKAGRKTA